MGIRKIFSAVLLLTFAGAAPALAQKTATWAGAKPPALKGGDPLPANLFVELAKAVNPGIVNISTSTLGRNVQRDPMLEMLERFYGVTPRRQGTPGKPRQMGLGTGFVVREDGLIITNAHVISGADIVTVQFDEGSDKTYEAQVLGSDARSDIALLKIKAPTKLTALALGSSEKTEVGEWVAAFGNPFGHGHTMTKGIISSKGRAIGEINKFPLLQTDAPINPGNSGGPLVNTRGEVIGVNSAINAMAQGISFAIPIDEVKRIIPQLESSGSLRKGFIGVGLGDVVSYTEDEEAQQGAGISIIDPKGPAAKAGLKLYDIVTEFNGRKIRNPTELMDAVGDAEPGSKAKIKVLRQEGSQPRERTLDITIAERPKDNTLARRSVEPADAAPAGKSAPFNLGFSVQDLTRDLREELNLPQDLKKPVVVGVKQGSVASFVGLRPGDILLEVNRSEVTNAAEVTKKLKKGENILKLARGNRIMIVSVASP
ncbi:MAG: trypsin-like peptidase domain-containing protein [Bdellovibrionaceae bacterium]|nr:trypsin-like peptidase domain-containing protein [Pseudobdellovibrionaceae bacterium]MBX3034183.1 trypsin-like peptidase domain-containing protein [Pseudobdellovibrionaceae bacterium]